MKFEYLCRCISDGDPTAAFNELGAEGWELVMAQGSHYTFKRSVGNPNQTGETQS